MPKITPFLWFDNNAEEAVAYYLSVFPNSRRSGELRASVDAGHVKQGGILTISFELDGQPFTALNGGPDHEFNEAVSFFVHCKDQAEIDYYWSKLGDGGEEIACGWLKDRFGLRWQIVPENILELVTPAAAMRAMMTMKKLDIAALENAKEE
jgi:predicted 3-demethylubiquinone-9 3-methyltransferase (glyoxalase superfamily)